MFKTKMKYKTIYGKQYLKSAWSFFSRYGFGARFEPQTAEDYITTMCSINWAGSAIRRSAMAIPIYDHVKFAGGDQVLATVPYNSLLRRVDMDLLHSIRKR